MSTELTPVAKLQIVMELLGGQEIYDEYGDPTGEKTPQLITEEQAKQLLFDTTLED